MGDCNDNLWSASSKRVRVWQTQPHAGTLLGSMPLIPVAAEGHQATKLSGPKKHVLWRMRILDWRKYGLWDV